ncbi:MAG: hypothetical protein U0Z44_08835 [Kouleothrix sp.]
MRTSADSTSWLRAALARTPGALGRPARQPTDTVRLMIAHRPRPAWRAAATRSAQPSCLARPA